MSINLIIAKLQFHSLCFITVLQGWVILTQMAFLHWWPAR